MNKKQRFKNDAMVLKKHKRVEIPAIDFSPMSKKTGKDSIKIIK